MTELIALLGIPAVCFTAMVVALVRRSRRGSARGGGEAARYPGSRNILHHKRTTFGEKSKGVTFLR